MSISSQATLVPSAQEAAALSKADANANFAADRKAGTGQQSCPKCQDKKTFCDIESLKITDTVSGRSVIAKMPLPRSAVKYPIADYGSDFVLEVVADAGEGFEAPSESPKPDATRKIRPKPNLAKPAPKEPNGACLQIEAIYSGACSNKQHPLIVLNPTVGDGGSPQRWAAAKPPEQKLFALPAMGDPGRTGPGAKWISPFWCFSNAVKELEIEAASCGTRVQGDPNGTLRGIVRIYRNDKYTLSFTMPVWREIKCERSSMIGLDGEKKDQRSFVVTQSGETIYANSAESTITPTAKGVDYADTVSTSQKESDSLRIKSETTGAKGGQAYLASNDTLTESKSTVGILARSSSVEHSDATDKKEELVFKTETEVKPEISLKRNDDEIEFTKVLNDLLDLHAAITRAWNAIQHWVPQIGWKFTFALSLFEGSIEGEWGTRAILANKSDSALWCERYFDFDFDCKVIAFKATASFGVNFSIEGFLNWFGKGKLLAIVLQVASTFEGEAQLKAKLSTRDNLSESKEINGTPVRPVQFNSKAIAKVFIEGRITIFGVDYKTEGSIVGGIQFDGVLTGTFDEEPNIYGRVFMVETKVFAYGVRGRIKSEPYERVIWGEKDIWSGEMLSYVGPTAPQKVI